MDLMNRFSYMYTLTVQAYFLKFICTLMLEWYKMIIMEHCLAILGNNIIVNI